MRERPSKTTAGRIRTLGAAVKTRKPTPVTILGTGLIGASIGLAARAAGAHVTGWDPDRRALRTALRRGALAIAAPTMASALKGARIVILAGPLDAILNQLPLVFSLADDGTLVLDCAGVKLPVVRRAARLLKRRSAMRFVAGHPIAGGERSGPAAASAALLKGRAFVLFAPPQNAQARAFSAAARFVQSLAMEPVRADPALHDRAVAALSALPQLSAIALALSAAPQAPRSWARLAGPGYRDATRLAASAFTVWKDSLQANRPQILRAVGRLAKRVHGIQAALQRKDWHTLMRIFLAAAAARRRVYPK